MCRPGRNAGAEGRGSRAVVAKNEAEETQEEEGACNLLGDRE